MKMCLCPNNHYYDQSVNSFCPHCAGGLNPGKTMPAVEPYQAGLGKTMPVDTVIDKQTGADSFADAKRNVAPMNVGQTKAVVQYENDLDPVVGWLVCVEGKNKGRDYRIHAENNFIGRDPSMDIAISDDEAVSRQTHAIISYDTRDRAYYFAQGTGRGIVRVNGRATLSTTQLEAYDRIEIGNTRFVFVPLCGEDFDWLTKE